MLVVSKDLFILMLDCSSGVEKGSLFKGVTYQHQVI